MVTVESKRQCEAHNQELRSVQTDFEKMHRLLQKATKGHSNRISLTDLLMGPVDYLVARHDSRASQRNAEEEIARLHALVQEVHEDKEAVKHQAKAETQVHTLVF